MVSIYFPNFPRYFSKLNWIWKSQAIEFIEPQNDDELWEDLIDYSMKNPRFVSGLLEHIGAYVDPVRLIKRIPNGMEVGVIFSIFWDSEKKSRFVSGVLFLTISFMNFPWFFLNFLWIASLFCLCFAIEPQRHVFVRHSRTKKCVHKYTFI